MSELEMDERYSRIDPQIHAAAERRNPPMPAVEMRDHARLNLDGRDPDDLTPIEKLAAFYPEVGALLADGIRLREIERRAREMAESGTDHGRAVARVILGEA
jgi:hypothetical protein